MKLIPNSQWKLMVSTRALIVSKQIGLNVSNIDRLDAIMAVLLGYVVSAT